MRKERRIYGEGSERGWGQPADWIDSVWGERERLRRDGGRGPKGRAAETRGAMRDPTWWNNFHRLSGFFSSEIPHVL